MKFFLVGLLLSVQSLFAYEELISCAQTEVSRTSVIFTCLHGEYYVEYNSTSKRDVKHLRVLFTKADKFKYMKNDKEKRD